MPTLASLARMPWVQRLLRARDAAEGEAALASAGLFFAVITSYLLVKPVRDALFLHKRRFDDQPLYYLITAAVIFVLGLLVNVAAARFSRRPLVVGSFVVFALVYLVFRVVFLLGPGVGAEAFLVWVSVHSLLAIYLFWALANDLFSPEQAVRLYGPIGAGGVLGSMVGASLAGVLARPLGTENLVLCSVGFQLLSLVLVLRLCALAEGRAVATDGAGSDGAPPGRGGSGTAGGPGGSPFAGLALMMRSPYLMSIAGIVVLVTLVGTFFTYQYSEVLQRSIPGKDEKTSFIGYFLFAQNMLAFLLQLLVVAPLQRRGGPLPGLLALVGLQLLGAFVLGSYALAKEVPGGAPVGPPLWLASALLLPMSAFFYSTHQSAKELLYTPLSTDEKYRAKVFADTFGFRLGDALSAGLLLIGRALGRVEPAFFVLAGIPLVLLRGVLSLRVSRAFEARSKAGATDAAGVGPGTRAG